MSNGPTSPNTYSILQAIQAIMQTAVLSNGQPAYANTVIGGLKDYVDVMPVGTSLPVNGSSERYTLGRSAKIHDIPHIAVGSVVSYANASIAMQQICAIRD